MPKVAFFFISCLLFLVGCGRQENPVGFGANYLEEREKFETKLTYVGPSPQDYEEDKRLPNVRSVRYPSQGRELKAWLYIPHGNDRGKYPALVYCHGGFSGDIEEVLSPEPFVKGGYVVMAPTFRGENGNPGNFEMMFGEVDDAVNAVRWLAEQPFVDADRIYMFGHSVGGGISALVSLMDDVPLRHTGSSGGLYPADTFLGWKDIAPFDPRDKTECGMRILDGNTASMKREHFAFLGKQDYVEGFSVAAKKYVLKRDLAPLLTVRVIPGDHFTSFDEAAQRYFKIVEADRDK